MGNEEVRAVVHHYKNGNCNKRNGGEIDSAEVSRHRNSLDRFLRPVKEGERPGGGRAISFPPRHVEKPAHRARSRKGPRTKALPVFGRAFGNGIELNAMSLPRGRQLRLPAVAEAITRDFSIEGGQIQILQYCVAHCGSTDKSADSAYPTMRA